MLFQTALVLLSAAAIRAQVTPTAPSPGQSFNEGSSCSMQWTLDTTGTWTNVSIDLMTGNNFNMILVENVVTGLDGTTGTGMYSWTCPEVTPNAAIYFYQFTNNGAGFEWTTRFTIAAADGSSTQPTNATQPTTGAAIPWGTGELVNAADNNSTSVPAIVTGSSIDPSDNSTTTSSSAASTSSSSASSSSTSTTAASRTSTSATSSTSSKSSSSTSASASASAKAAGAASLDFNVKSVVAAGLVVLGALTVL